MTSILSQSLVMRRSAQTRASTIFSSGSFELRASIKATIKAQPPSEREALDSAQQTLKIIASSTSYGIFMEMNVEALAKPTSAFRYRDDGTSFSVSLDQVERPGQYFHPLLATFITAAARLMLGIAERLAADRGLDWAFCDTDSMAFAKPQDMTDADFYQHVAHIRSWFDALNPYDGAGELFKLEETNFALKDGKPAAELQALFLWAISAKRYVLFNISQDGLPITRKASAHGLGHLMPPYSATEAPSSIPAPALSLKDIGVERWQYDVWYRIVEAALNGHADQPQLADLPNFDRPAASRYAATTPALLRWFDAYNKGKDYAAQVRAFNFLTAFQPKLASPFEWDVGERPEMSAQRRTRSDLPRPIAPFHSEPARAARQCFDRATGDAISPDRLKTYAETLAQYHLHPEAKFLNGNYLDNGRTRRRHIHTTAIRAIGKEANDWERQLYLGFDPKTQVDYGIEADGIVAVRGRVCEAARAFGQRRLAEVARVSRERLRLFIVGKAVLRSKTVVRLLSAISALAGSADDQST